MAQKRAPIVEAMRKLVVPVAKKVLYETVRPNALTRPVYAAAFDAHWYTREMWEWAYRSLVATPGFLAKCARFGERVSIDRLPYLNGPVHIELGDDVRFSGTVAISGNTRTRGRLRIGNGVFLAHGTHIAVAKSVEIGNYVSVGSLTYIADTEGHANYNPQRPIWEVPASDDDIAPVVIEDGVQISKHCMILKGVRIGARSIIGAGSVVRSNIPPDSIVMGNPARVVRRITADADGAGEGANGANGVKAVAS
jgi:acetyltransferase-like isoleucine patch superfamily enzyme